MLLLKEVRSLEVEGETIGSKCPKPVFNEVITGGKRYE